MQDSRPKLAMEGNIRKDPPTPKRNHNPIHATRKKEGLLRKDHPTPKHTPNGAITTQVTNATKQEREMYFVPEKVVRSIVNRKDCLAETTLSTWLDRTIKSLETQTEEHCIVTMDLATLKG